MNDVVRGNVYTQQLEDMLKELQGNDHVDGTIAYDQPSIAERARQRVTNREISRQQNIEDAATVAASSLAAESAVTATQPVDKDWFSYYIENVQDVSDTEMKFLWGKVLAGEIKHPKRFSLRTLRILRHLLKEEAAIIKKVVNYALIDDSGKYAIFHSYRDDNDMIKFEDLLLLDEIGLLDTSASLSLMWPFNDTDEEKCVKLYNGNIGINIYTKNKDLTLPCYVTTKPGAQIFSLIEDVKPNTDYYKSVFDELINPNNRYVCGHISEEGEDSGFIFSDELFRK